MQARVYTMSGEEYGSSVFDPFSRLDSPSGDGSTFPCRMPAFIEGRVR
jgi:hypothetical protein